MVTLARVGAAKVRFPSLSELIVHSSCVEAYAAHPEAFSPPPPRSSFTVMMRFRSIRFYFARNSLPSSSFERLRFRKLFKRLLRQSIKVVESLKVSLGPSANVPNPVKIAYFTGKLLQICKAINNLQSLRETAS